MSSAVLPLRRPPPARAIKKFRPAPAFQVVSSGVTDFNTFWCRTQRSFQISRPNADSVDARSTSLRRVVAELNPSLFKEWSDEHVATFGMRAALVGAFDFGLWGRQAQSFASSTDDCARLEKMKTLVGTWVAADKDGKPTDEVVSVIKLTAGG